MGIFFFCAPPPYYLITGTDLDKKKYWKQLSYYNAIKKLPLINFKLARIVGSNKTIHEKNLDTQLSVCMPSLASKDFFDVAILVAHDGDYADTIREVMALGKKVELVGFKDKCSMNLRKVCNITRRLRFSYLKDLKFLVKNSLK